jgi:ribonuclease-3
MTPADELEREATRLSDAETLLGRAFRDRALLLSALTHRSFLNEQRSTVAHNELLELLGDAVLSLVVVEHLVRDNPGAGEGSLTERRAAHVSTENLARVAVSSGLVTLLRTGRSLVGGVPENAAADVVEAVLGACYLDQGIEGARAVVAQLLGPPPTTATPLIANAKKDLQERLQRVFGRAPEYVVSHKEGPNHAPVFAADVVLGDAVLGSGEGRNKRAATEAAAAAALVRMADVDDPGLRARLRTSQLPTTALPSSISLLPTTMLPTTMLPMASTLLPTTTLPTTTLATTTLATTTAPVTDARPGGSEGGGAAPTTAAAPRARR